MEESEPTLSTEPSSSAMRARALTWVFTRSCQFTTVLAAAGMVLPLRARFTAGITRETSPARGPVPAGAAELSQGIATSQESRSEEHTSELQSRLHLVCRLLLEKKKHR